MILAAPPGYQPTTALRDLTLLHPWLLARWQKLQPVLALRGLPLLELEGYRYDIRQQYLWGAGRTGADCVRANVPSAFARPRDPIVTHATSAASSAHGFTRLDESGRVVPAAVALDCDPVGPDGRPFSSDDQWAAFVTTLEADANALGLRHFRNNCGVITDQQHLQLVEWNDHTRTLGPAGPFATVPLPLTAPASA